MNFGFPCSECSCQKCNCPLNYDDTVDYTFDGCSGCPPCQFYFTVDPGATSTWSGFSGMSSAQKTALHDALSLTTTLVRTGPDPAGKLNYVNYGLVFSTWFYPPLQTAVDPIYWYTFSGVGLSQLNWDSGAITQYDGGSPESTNGTFFGNGPHGDSPFNSVAYNAGSGVTLRRAWFVLPSDFMNNSDWCLSSFDKTHTATDDYDHWASCSVSGSTIEGYFPSGSLRLHW